LFFHRRKEELFQQKEKGKPHAIDKKARANPLKIGVYVKLQGIM
jgi:hypothetical protein